MNAVARTALADSGFTRGVVFRFDLPELKMLILVFLLLVSALGVVYVKDLNRRLLITTNDLQTYTHQLKVKGNKLLLEQSSWAAQSRVQILAEQYLEMRIPRSKDVIMIRV